MQLITNQSEYSIFVILRNCLPVIKSCSWHSQDTNHNAEYAENYGEGGRAKKSFKSAENDLKLKILLTE